MTKTNNVLNPKAIEENTINTKRVFADGEKERNADIGIIAESRKAIKLA